jgi:arylsulfatase A-like enzyme
MTEMISRIKSINRRRFLSLAAGSTVGLLMPLGELSIAAKRARKPNIIFIMADDSGYGDLGCYGQSKIKTPNLDRMAAEGMRFTQHYSGSTVCAPSRCALMTGLHTGHCRIRGNDPAPLRPQDITVAEMLKKAGYTTGITGKWGLGEAGTTGTPNKKGFDYFFGYLNQRNAHSYYPPYLWRNEDKVILEDNQNQMRKTYSHDLITEQAIGFIKNNKQGPFFLYVAYTIPHVELAVPEDSLAQYKGKFPEKAFDDVTSHYHTQETPHAAYAAMISLMDRDIGRILAQLKQLNIDNDTVVMYTSDNGPEKKAGADPPFFKSSGPFRGLKRDLYEGGIRVPLIIRWQNKVKANSVSDHVSGFWDFMPTCADIAQAQAPGNIDGISYLPTLLGNPAKQKKHKYLYWEFHERGGRQALRWGKWKAVRLNVHKKPNGPLELYDLESDIAEQNNIADKHGDIVAAIESMMGSARTQSEIWPI